MLKDTRYTSFDRCKFDYDEDRINYEFQRLYEKSGYTLYKNGIKIETLFKDPYTVLSWDYFTLDRSKPEENIKFKEYAFDMYGYLFEK